MIAFNFFSTITFTCFIILGLYILLSFPLNHINILFFIKSLLFAGCSLTSMLIQFSIETEQLFFWYRLYLIDITILTAVFLHFYIDFTSLRVGSLVKIALYIPALIVILLIYILDSSFLTWERQSDGIWILSESFDNISLITYAIYVTLYPFFSIAMIYKWAKKSPFNKEKKQARIIIAAIFITLILSDFSDLVMAHFDFYKVPHILPLMFSLYFISISYVLVKYNFLKFDISHVTDEIISNIRDMVVLIKPDGSIISSNAAFLKMVDCDSPENQHLNIFNIVDTSAQLRKSINELINGSAASMNERIVYQIKSEKIITDSYMSRISDKFKDLVALLVVSKENSGIKHFKKMYGITDRQLEIIQMAIDGFSNAEISDKLSLARRTVETHLFNIYCKLSINNKMELAKIANNFNLFA